MSEHSHDLVILGGGPGGYRAAELAGKRGMSVALVEREHLGGVCLNRGCIPTKRFSNSAKVFSHLADAAAFGVHTEGAHYSLEGAMSWKRDTIDIRDVEKQLLCIDMGHFHPSELVADKISSILLFVPELLLHISRPMRWDSDHGVLFNDDLRILAEELVRSGRINDVYLGLDFFDASINRIGAWAVGSRSTLKGLLAALLQPADTLLAISETATSSREWLS